MHLSTQLFLSYVWQASPLTECCLLPAVRWNWFCLWECIRPFIKNLMAFPPKQASSLAQENRKRVRAKETMVIKWIKDDSQYGVPQNQLLRQGLVYWHTVNWCESSLLQTSTEGCKNKKKKREPVKDVFLRCYHCGHLSGTQGVLLGSPRDRREQVSRSSPWESRVRGWWRCAFLDTLACLPYMRRAWPRTRGHIEPKAVGTVRQYSSPGWGGGALGGTWEAPALMLQQAAESGGGQRMQPCLPRAFSGHTYLWEKFMVKPARLLT